MIRSTICASLLAITLAFAASSTVGQCIAPSFEAGINIEAGSIPSDIAVGDLDSDGRTDIVIPNFGSNTISIAFGNATGGPRIVLLTFVQAPYAVAVADFNHDGKLDLAVSHGPNFSPQFVAILLGDGAGGFGPPADFSVASSSSLVVADFNNDGNPDVFLGNSSTGTSQVLLGNGSGGLAAPFTVALPNNSKVVAGDFNNDGKMDLAIEYDGTAFVSIVLGDGTGHFGSAASFPISRPQFGSIAAGDFNNDSKVDLVTAGQSDGISVLLGNGAGSFAAATSISTGFTTRAVAVGDFNGDGKPDVATTGANVIALLVGNGTGSFGPHTPYALNQTPIDLVLGDVNGDGKLDAATANAPPSLPPLDGSVLTDRGTVLLGDGTGKLRFAAVLAGLSPFAISNADLNNDGRLDLAVANIGHNNVTILLANASGGFLSPTTVAVGDQPRSVALGDLDGDQNLDLVTANFNARTVSVLLGVGLGSFSTANNLSLPGFGPDYVTIADFNNDGKADLAVAYLNSNFISILLGNGTGGFGAPTNATVPSGGQQISPGDFNLDGQADLAVATISGVSVLLGNGNGGFVAPRALPTNSTANSVVVDDFNSDGKADLAAVISNNKVVLVYLGDGQGDFGTPTSFTTGSGPTFVVVADYNSDGHPDLATANIDGTASVLLGNGAGSFSAAVKYLVGGSVTRSITSGDFNGDGRPDLALANQGGGFPTSVPGNISILFNSCLSAPPSLPSLSISDVMITEGNSGTSAAIFNVALSAPSTKPITVSLYSAPQDASKSVDFQITQGGILFPPGTTSQTITVSVIGDTLDEFDEQFAVLLAYPLNAQISKSRGQGTILDDDPPPTVSITDVTLNEGNTGTAAAIFTVSLSGPSGKPISLSIATADDSATTGSDYQSISATLNFSPGQTSQTAGVLILGDSIAEADERFLVNITNPVNVTLLNAQGLGTILNDDTNVKFSSAALQANEADGSIQITVTRTGVLSENSTVNYSTSDSTASERTDYNLALGTLRFTPNETSKTVTVFITDDILLENPETFSVTLSAPVGCTLGSPATSIITINSDDLAVGPNPIDVASFFVRQHYRDFLNRDPDSDGLAYWGNQITECQQPGATCNAEVRRINVSAAFFVSIEFQETGYLVYRTYKAAFGNITGTPVPLRLNEFLADTQQIREGVVVGVGNWQTQLANNKVAFGQNFVARSRFSGAYPTTSTPAEFVDALYTKTGVTPSATDRDAAIAEFSGAGTTADTAARGRALQRVAENSSFTQQEFNRAFVLMQYFGYLRRNPNDSPDSDYGGYEFWLDKLNQFNGNYIAAEMVKAFIDSIEYRQRFGP